MSDYIELDMYWPVKPTKYFIGIAIDYDADSGARDRDGRDYDISLDVIVYEDDYPFQYTQLIKYLEPKVTSMEDIKKIPLFLAENEKLYATYIFQVEVTTYKGGKTVTEIFGPSPFDSLKIS
jgi:hypothetical protein